MTRIILAAASTLLLVSHAVDARTIYVSNEKGNSISIVDGDKLELVEEVAVGERPRGIVLSPDGKFLYVCASDDDTVQILDTATLEIVGTLPSGPDPEVIVISPDGKTLYAANEDDNLVTVIDIERRADDQRDPGRRRARGHGGEPRWRDHRQHLRDHQHGAFHRRREPRDHPQRAGRPAAAGRRVHRRRRRGLGQRRRSAARSA